MSEINAEQSALHGPVILSGQFSRDNTIRDVMEIITQSKDVEFGVLRILSKELRGYVGISRGGTIVGGHTTSTQEFGMPSLRQLLSAGKGMFMYVHVEQFPIEVRQSLTIPVQELLEWRPYGVPPNLVPLLSQALAPFEQAMEQAAQGSECMDALRAGTLPAPMDEAAEEKDFAFYWDEKGSEEAPAAAQASPLQSLVPQAEPTRPTAAPAAAPEPIKVKADVAASWMPSTPQPAHRPPMPVKPKPEPEPEPAAEAEPQPQPQPEPQTGLQQWPDSPGTGWAEKVAPPPAAPPERPASQVEAAPSAPAWTQNPQPEPPAPPANWNQTAAPTPGNGWAQDSTRDQGWTLDQLNQIGAQAPTNDPNLALSDPKVPLHARKIEREEEEERDPASLPLQESGRFATQARLAESGTFTKEDVQALSGRFKAVEEGLPDFLPGAGATFDPRELMQTEAPKRPWYAFHPITLLSVILAMGLLAFLGVQIVGAMNATTPSLVNQGADNLRQGQTDKAINNLNAAIAATPNNIAAHTVKAVALLESKKYAETVKACDAILNADPNYTDALRIRSFAKSELGQYKEAVADVDEYLAKAPDDAPIARSQALAVRAFADLKLKKLDQSLSDYDKAIKLDEKNMHLFASRGFVKSQKKGK